MPVPISLRGPFFYQTLNSHRQPFALTKEQKIEIDSIARVLNCFAAVDYDQKFQFDPTHCPIFGPVTVADYIQVTGFISSFSLSTLGFGDPRTNSLIRQFKSLNASILAKTAVSDRQDDVQTYSKLSGHCRTAHQLNHNTGGSCGGGAAAVSAGLSVLDIGLDIHGNTRVPAAFCGVVNYVPSEKIFSNDWILRKKVLPEYFIRLSFTTKSVAELSYVQQLLGNIDTANLSKNVRIGYWLPDHGLSYKHSNSESYRQTIQYLEQIPEITLVPCTLSELFNDEIKELFAIAYGYLTARSTSAWSRWLMRLTARLLPDTNEQSFRVMFYKGFRLNKREGMKLLQRLEQVRYETWQKLNQYDIFICPVSPEQHLRHKLPESESILGACYTELAHCTDEVEVSIFDYLHQFTVPLSALGAPTVVMNMHSQGTRRDYKTSFQLFAPPGQDDLLIKTALFIEQQAAELSMTYNWR